jgi:hypothetical protein
MTFFHAFRQGFTSPVKPKGLFPNLVDVKGMYHQLNMSGEDYSDILVEMPIKEALKGLEKGKKQQSFVA